MHVASLLLQEWGVRENFIGSADFLGLNYYFSMIVRERRPEEHRFDEDIFQLDAGVVESQNPKWKQ